MEARTIIEEGLKEAANVLTSFMKEERNLVSIQNASELCISSLAQDGKIISCGNGGSMSDAMHFAEELTGRFRDDRRPLAAIAISDPSYLSCTANDYGYDQVFSRYVEGVGRKGDVLLAISTSGNSDNVVNAAAAASDKGMKVIALTGKDGGRLAGMADVEIRVSHQGYADRIQEVHIKIIHLLIQLIESKI